MPHVGFWKESADSGWYPGKVTYTAVPIANSATEDQGPLLSHLIKVEQLAQCVDYLGASMCRICNRYNGNSEYTYDGFTWPAGYAHYLRDHRVAIDPDFKEMLLAAVR